MADDPRFGKKFGKRYGVEGLYHVSFRQAPYRKDT